MQRLLDYMSMVSIPDVYRLESLVRLLKYHTWYQSCRYAEYFVSNARWKKQTSTKTRTRSTWLNGTDYIDYLDKHIGQFLHYNSS